MPETVLSKRLLLRYFSIRRQKKNDCPPLDPVRDNPAWTLTWQPSPASCTQNKKKGLPRTEHCGYWKPSSHDHLERNEGIKLQVSTRQPTAILGWKIFGIPVVELNVRDQMMVGRMIRIPRAQVVEDPLLQVMAEEFVACWGKIQSSDLRKIHLFFFPPFSFGLKQMAKNVRETRRESLVETWDVMDKGNWSHWAFLYWGVWGHPVNQESSLVREVPPRSWEVTLIYLLKKNINSTWRRLITRHFSLALYC